MSAKFRFLPFLFLALFLLTFPKLSSIIHSITHEFTLSRILYKKSPFPCEIKSIYDEEAYKKAIAQSYHFLGFGGQSYSFVSEDGNYVIKFLKKDLYIPPFWTYILPLNLKEKQFEKRALRTQRDMTSYFIAAHHLAKECGLIAIKMGHDRAFRKEVTIYDPLQIAHKVQLKHCQFIIQKKATLLLDYLSQLIQEGKINEGKSAIDELLLFLIQRYQRGIYDGDAKIHRNLGFIEGHPLFIDVGRFAFDPHCKKKDFINEEIKKETKRLYEWLKIHSLDLANHLEVQLRENETLH